VGTESFQANQRQCRGIWSEHGQSAYSHLSARCVKAFQGENCRKWGRGEGQGNRYWNAEEVGKTGGSGGDGAGLGRVESGLKEHLRGGITRADKRENERQNSNRTEG